MLALVERPGVRAAANIPFRPGEISGGMTAHVLMTVPLAGGRTDLRASGELRSVSLRRAFRNRNVNARRMQFTLDPSEFQMLGEVTIGRAPLALRWRERLADDGPGRRVVDVKGRLDAEGRRTLGIDLGDWITGPVDAHARLAPRSQGATAMHLTADLEHAAIDLPLLNIMKEEGAPGTVDAQLVVAGGQLTAVDDFRLRAAGSSIDGRALLGPEETWRTIDGTIVMAPRSHGAGFTRAIAKLTPGVTGSQLTITRGRRRRSAARRRRLRRRDRRPRKADRRNPLERAGDAVHRDARRRTVRAPPLAHGREDRGDGARHGHRRCAGRRRPAPVAALGHLHPAGRRHHGGGRHRGGARRRAHAARERRSAQRRAVARRHPGAEPRGPGEAGAEPVGGRRPSPISTSVGSARSTSP